MTPFDHDAELRRYHSRPREAVDVRPDDPTRPPVPALDPFSLADPATVRGVLAAAGFTDVTVADVREPVYHGADPAAAVDSVLALRMAGDVLDRLDAGATDAALDRLRSVMAAHDTGDGVWFDSRAWPVTARST